MSESTQKRDTKKTFNIFNLYFTFYEYKSSITEIQVRIEGSNHGDSRQKSHWLRDLCRRRLKQPIDVPWARLDTDQLTKFQRSVLEVLDEVPPGETISYGDLARRLNRDGQAQAVGQALRRNPFPVLLPCHRVIRADGTLGGYGGETDSSLKKRLLVLEKELAE
jgi:O-6-methylguanine DNA methyltransferase